MCSGNKMKQTVLFRRKHQEIIMPFFNILQKFEYFKLFLIRLLHTSETTLGEFQVSTDIPFS